MAYQLIPLIIVRSKPVLLLGIGGDRPGNFQSVAIDAHEPRLGKNFTEELESKGVGGKLLNDNRAPSD
jgi:hypothetical protein